MARYSRIIFFLLGDELPAGGLGCGDNLVKAGITAQGIPARIKTEIAVGKVAGIFGSISSFSKVRFALARPRVHPRQV